MSDQELAVINEPTMLNPTQAYSSIQAVSQEEKLELYDKISNTDSLKEMVNITIPMTDLIAMPVEIANQKTGEIESALRVVIVAEDGNAYGCVSRGVRTSVENLFLTVGEPPYSPAIPLTPVLKKGRNGFEFMSLQYTPKGKAKK